MASSPTTMSRTASTSRSGITSGITHQPSIRTRRTISSVFKPVLLLPDPSVPSIRPSYLLGHRSTPHARSLSDRGRGLRSAGCKGAGCRPGLRPGTRRAAGGWTRLALAARPVRGLRRMSIALRILPSPYPLQHWPVLGGSASAFEADDGRLPAGRYDTDPISRRERGRRKSLRATTLARDGGSGGNGIGNANWLSRYVRCRRHHLFGCQGAVRRARAMAGGIRSCARMRVAGRSRLRHNQHSFVARGLRVFVVVGPRP